MDLHAATSVAQALELVLASAQPLGHVEVVPDIAHTRVLASDLHARITLPGSDVSTMDGWAFHSDDARDDVTIRLREVGESAAGHPFPRELQAGETVRIATGATIPGHADTIVPIELASSHDGTLEISRDSVRAALHGDWIRRQGSEITSGELLLPAGTRLAAGDLALVAAAGYTTIPIHRPPRVAILATGDELVPIGQRPGPGQSVETNATMLAAQTREAGAIPMHLGHVADDRAELERAIARGLRADVLVTSGGISVGEHDLVLEILEHMHAAIVVRGVRMRPGKPMTFARVERVFVFALPGNPASSFVTFELFVRPLIRKLLGMRDHLFRPRRKIVLARPLAATGNRAHYVRARLVDDRAVPHENQASGNVRSISAIELLLELPAGAGPFGPGDEVDALVLGCP